MYFTLMPKQWANLLYYREQIDIEVKALDCKSRLVDFRVTSAMDSDRERRLELCAYVSL